MMEEKQTLRSRIAALQARAQALGFSGDDPDPKAAKQASDELWGEDDPVLSMEDSLEALEAKAKALMDMYPSNTAKQDAVAHDAFPSRPAPKARPFG